MSADKNRIAGHAIWVIGGPRRATVRTLRVGPGPVRIGQMEIVFPLPMAVLMKIARLLPVRLWAAVSSRATKTKAAR